MAMFQGMTPLEIAQRIAWADPRKIRKQRIRWRKSTPSVPGPLDKQVANRNLRDRVSPFTWEPDGRRIQHLDGGTSKIFKGRRGFRRDERARAHHRAHVANPLPTERDRPKFGGLYSREEFESDIFNLESARQALLTLFTAGQLGQGPLMDGVVYLGKDTALLQAISDCERKYRASIGIIIKSREATKLQKRIATPKQAVSPLWKNIGNDPDLARAFEHSGFKVRRIETGLQHNHCYEVFPRIRKGKHAADQG